MKSNPFIHFYTPSIRLQPKLGAIFDFPGAQHPVRSVLVTPELSSQKKALKTSKRAKSNMADSSASFDYFDQHLILVHYKLITPSALHSSSIHQASTHSQHFHQFTEDRVEKNICTSYLSDLLCHIVSPVN